MKEISYPPKIISKLSLDERKQISQAIFNNQEIGFAWLEKIRKFISFHNRNLKRISTKRFDKEASAHLIWMKEIIYAQISSSNDFIIDSALLNAAFIISDACPSNSKQKNYLYNLIDKYQKDLINTHPQELKSISKIKQCKFSFNSWKSADCKKIPVTIFSPSPYSLFSISVLKILLALNIEVKAIVILKFSFSRIRSELYRDGLKLFFKRVWRKLILRADENKVKTGLSLMHLKNSIAPEISDIRQLAKSKNIPCYMVDTFSDSLNVQKNKKGDLCIFTGGGLISKQVLDYFSYGVINVHMGPLPQYKGMDVVEAPILDGAFNSIALTSHLMEAKLDSGPLITEMSFISDEYQSLDALRNEMGAMMPILAIDSIISILSNPENLYDQEPEGKQYYFIHHRLREIITEVMFSRFNSSNSNLLKDRDRKLDAFNLLISDFTHVS